MAWVINQTAAHGVLPRPLPPPSYSPVVVVLLPDPTLDAYRSALRDGADGVVDWHAPPTLIGDMVVAAVRGETVLPTEVARQLAGSPRDPAFDAPPELSAADLRALHALGNGVTMAELADREASSERDMYRQLQRIWLRLGVNNRHAAMVRAVKLGLLD